MVKFGFVFMTLALSIGVNLEEGFLLRLGFHPDMLKATAVAFVLTGLVVHRRLALIIGTVLLTIGANAPVEAAAQIGYDPDWLLAALVGMVLIPYLARVVDGFDF